MGDPRLAPSSRDRIAEPDNQVLVSAVSAWEVGVKTALGKLEAPGNLIEVVDESGLSWIPLEAYEAYAAGDLPMHHRDPFDRLLIAQAMLRSVPLISIDRSFDAYPIRRLWSK